MMKFSIRDLLLVTAIVALAVGWLVDHRRQANRPDEWKFYATCLEKLLMDDGFEILRDKEWVRATRIAPCLSSPGDSATVGAKLGP